MENSRATGTGQVYVWKEGLSKNNLETTVKQSGPVVYEEHITEDRIRGYLKEEYKALEIQVFPETTSTNALAKLAAAQGQKAPVLFVAERQTEGRGRRGRSFLSVPGEMICMSLLLRPQFHAADAVFLTTAVCMAVWRAIREVCGLETEIKWVNDLYYRGKKVCGILTEAVTDSTTGIVDYVVPGIGINFCVEPEQFPEELSEIAGALYTGKEPCRGYEAENEKQKRNPGKSKAIGGERTPDAPTRNELIAEIVHQVFVVLDDLDKRTFMQEYRAHSMLIGKQIRIMTEPFEEARVLDIDENGGLVVQLEDGSRRVLNTGEVTVRKIEV